MDFNDAARMVTKDGIAALQGRKATDLYGDQPDIMRDLERCLKDRLGLQARDAPSLSDNGVKSAH